MRVIPVFVLAFILCEAPAPLFAETAPYRTSLAVDVPLLVAGVGVSVFGNVRYAGMEARSELPDKEDLWACDRPFAGQKNRAADLASDWMSLAIAVPFAYEGYSFFAGKSDGGEVATFFLSAFEIGCIQNGLNLLVRSARLHPRPELYASGADLSRGEAWGSFYSGHTSAAFALAVFSGMWFEAKNPESSLIPAVWGVSLSAAAAVGVLRVWAGKHYPSDVLAGAAVGSLTGYAVLRAHRSSAVSVAALPGYLGVSVRF